MNAEVLKLWPELEWIEDESLREATAKTWELALERSPLTAEDLQTIPFTLLVPNLKVSFMAHKRCVVHVARESAIKMNEFFKDELPVNLDVTIAGAILADVGKLLEYDIKDGKSCKSDTGRYLRHPFTGVAVLARGLVGSVGDVATVASPLHKQRFDLRTGRCLDDADQSVRVWDTLVVEGIVWVSADPQTPVGG